MLNWDNPEKIRSEGIRLAKEIEDLSLLIQPYADPSVWECCAEIICEKSDVILEPYLDGLLEWLQDLNLPGALTVLERLKGFSGKMLKQPFVKCYTRATALNNQEGLMWVDYLSELLDNNELKAELSNETIKRLQKHYHNWGAWYND